jgi:hypothetical protein
MKLAQDVYTRLQQRLLHECRSMRATRQEMKQLSDAYFRYVDLDRQLETSRHRTSIILGLLGPAHVTETMRVTDADCLAEFPAPDELRKKLRLWRAVREYLRMAGDSKVGDVQEFLNWLGMENVTRQAIESAMKRHSDWFEITKKGHERYLTLKK